MTSGSCVSTCSTSLCCLCIQSLFGWWAWQTAIKMAKRSSKFFLLLLNIDWGLGHLISIAATHITCKIKQIIKSFHALASPSKGLKDLWMASVFIVVSETMQCWICINGGVCLLLMTSLPLEGYGRIEMKSCGLAFLTPTEVIQKFWRFFEGNFCFSLTRTHTITLTNSPLVCFLIYKMGLITPTSQGSVDN